MTRWVKRGGRAARVEADGEVRRSQAIRTYGAGSLMDLLDRSVLIGGLDFWNFGTEGPTKIDERRLRESVAKMLSKQDDPVVLSEDKAFLLPPAGQDGEPQRNNGIEVFEFRSGSSARRPTAGRSCGRATGSSFATTAGSTIATHASPARQCRSGS